MKNSFRLISMIGCAAIILMSIQGICEDNKYQEGIFQVILPSIWTRIPDQMLNELKNL